MGSSECREVSKEQFWRQKEHRSESASTIPQQLESQHRLGSPAEFFATSAFHPAWPPQDIFAAKHANEFFPDQKHCYVDTQSVKEANLTALSNGQGLQTAAFAPSEEQKWLRYRHAGNHQ